MDSLLPAHAAIVHLPLGIAFVLPLAAAVLALGAWRGGSRHGWVAVLVLEAALVGGALLGQRSGEAAEDPAEERGVAHDLIEEHEERATAFTWIGGGALALSIAALAAARTRAHRPLVAAAALATLPVAGAAAWTGLAGGAIAHPDEPRAAAARADEDAQAPAAAGDGHDAMAPAATLATHGHAHEAHAGHDAPAAPADVAPLLPARLRAAVTTEMIGLQEAVPRAVSALAAGDWGTLEAAAEGIASSELLRQQLTPEEHDVLHASLPPAFVTLDTAFHEEARGLAQAARARDRAAASARLSAMVSSCAGCHAQHAPTRFPGL